MRRMAASSAPSFTAAWSPTWSASCPQKAVSSRNPLIHSGKREHSDWPDCSRPNRWGLGDGRRGRTPEQRDPARPCGLRGKGDAVQATPAMRAAIQATALGFRRVNPRQSASENPDAVAGEDGTGGKPGEEVVYVGLVSDDLSVTGTKPLDRLLARKSRGARPLPSNDPGKIARKPVCFSENAHLDGFEAQDCRFLVGARLRNRPYALAGRVLETPFSMKRRPILHSSSSDIDVTFRWLMTSPENCFCVCLGCCIRTDQPYPGFRAKA